MQLLQQEEAVESLEEMQEYLHERGILTSILSHRGKDTLWLMLDAQSEDAQRCLADPHYQPLNPVDIDHYLQNEDLLRSSALAGMARTMALVLGWTLLLAAAAFVSYQLLAP